MINISSVPKNFFGREKELTFLVKRVNSFRKGYRQNIAFVGQPLSGKTSLLNYFIQQYINSPDILPIYIEMQKEDFKSFAERFIGTLLYEYLKSIGKSPVQNFQVLINETRILLPNTISYIEKICKDFESRNQNDAYNALLQLPSEIKKEANKRCIIFLDEFHNLLYFNLKSPFTSFGKVMMVQRDTMYVITSSEKSTVQKILSEKLSLLFGNFEVIELKGFDFKTSEQFIENRLKDLFLENNLKKFLVYFTDGNPFYSDIILAKIKGICFSKNLKVVDEQIVAEAIEDLLFNPKGNINQYFQFLLEATAKSQTAKNVLIKISKGNNTVTKLRLSLGIPQSKIMQHIQLFLDADIIEKNGVFFYFKDLLFEFWLRAILYKRESGLISNIFDKAKEFQLEFGCFIDHFYHENNISNEEKIKKLMALFQNEIVEINEKRRILPKFEKYIVEFDDGNISAIIAKSGTKNWLWIINKHFQSEQHFCEAINNICKKFPTLTTRRILVLINGIDINSLLFTKEKNFWIWKLKDLNRILHIYNNIKILD